MVIRVKLSLDEAGRSRKTANLKDKMSSGPVEAYNAEDIEAG